MTELTLKDASTVHFHPLRKQPDGDEWLVGREPGPSGFVSLPTVGVEIIELLQQQKTIGQAKAEIAAIYGEVPEIEPFLETLVECGFVESIDGVVVSTGRAERRPFWPSLRAGQVAWMFSRPALALYAAAAGWAIGLWIALPRYLPRFSDWFYSPSLTVVMVSLFLMSWLHIVWHEFWHFLAARAVGVQANFSLGTRLIYLVAETDVSGVWGIPREKRYIVFLAGMIGDLQLSAFYLTLLVLNDTGHLILPVLFYRLLKALIFMEFWGLLWQFEFQMRTDIYYLIASLANCKNLMQDSQTLLRSRLKEVFGGWPLPRAWKANWAAADLSAVPERELRAVRMYLPLYLIGTVVILGNFFLRSLPVTWEYLSRSVASLGLGQAADPRGFLDAVVFVALTAFTYGLLIHLKWRERRHS